MRVLVSFNKPPDASFLFVTLFARSLRDAGCEVTYFSPRAAFSRIDVFNLHWPELMVSGSSGVRRLVKWGCLLVLLLRLRAQRIPVVHTMHNLRPHDDIQSPMARWLHDAFLRTVTVRVYLNESPENDLSNGVVILHGLYPTGELDGCPIWRRDEAYEVLFFGNIRRYKGIERLIDVYTRSDLCAHLPSLRVVGKPNDQAYAAELRAMTAEVAKISFRDDFLPDKELCDLIAHAAVVVLPYRQMYNSGVALLALSVGAPVLLPASPANGALQAELGKGWVSLFPPDAGSDGLADAISTALNAPRTGVPDLSRRAWGDIGALYMDLFSDLTSSTEGVATGLDANAWLAHSPLNAVFIGAR